MNVKNLRRLSHVPRCTILRTIRDTNVAEHTFHVMWIYVWLCRDVLSKPLYVMELLDVLYHDEKEGETGDTPSSEKTYTDPTTPHEASLMLADKLEFILYCDEERAMGNTTLRAARAHAWGRAQKSWDWLWQNWGGVASWRSLDTVYEALWSKTNG